MSRNDMGTSLPKKTNFRKKNLIQRLRMPLPELEAYYRKKREYEYSYDLPVRGIRWRKWLHPLLYAGVAFGCRARGQRLTVIADERVRTDKPVIYAITHQGRYDIEIGLLAAKKQFWFFYGDPGPVYQDFDGVLLFLNGAIYLDTLYRKDCFHGKERAIKTLKAKGSVFIAPEGAWNITPNQPVMKLYKGTAEIAIRSGASIVPIAIEKYGSQFYAKIGRNIEGSTYRMEQIGELTEHLHDTLSTLKWEIWESQGIANRDELPPDALEQFVNEIMSETENGYTIEEIERTRYHDKSITAPAEAFEHLEHLIPRRENAFLFREIKSIR